jgi:hypothetical protein
MRRLSDNMVTTPIRRRPLHLSLFIGSLAWRPGLHIEFLYTIALTACERPSLTPRSFAYSINCAGGTRLARSGARSAAYRTFAVDIGDVVSRCRVLPLIELARARLGCI